MARRRAREFALAALYQADISGDGVSPALKGLLLGQLDDGVDGKVAEPDEVEFAQRIADGVDAELAKIDEHIEGASKNWRLVRMPVVDRNILRLATFELMQCPDVPVSVTINEAVELAKRFGDKESKAFVNGLLDRIASDLGRGGRRQHKR